MADSNKIHALIWDMGGVLVRNMNPSIRGQLATPYGMTYMDLENLFFGNEVAHQATIGLAHEADSWEFVRQKLNISPEAMPAFTETFWSSDLLDEELYTFIMALKPHYKIGLVSNAFPEARASLTRSFPHFFNMFDVAIFSAEVKIAKPDPRIFQLALNELGVRAEEAVFVDDFIKNVEGARAVGMQAIHFKNSLQVRSELKELLG